MVGVVVGFDKTKKKTTTTTTSVDRSDGRTDEPWLAIYDLSNGYNISMEGLWLLDTASGVAGLVSKDSLSLSFYAYIYIHK